MEIVKLDIVGSYCYNPDIEIKNYENNKHTLECVICKRLLYESSYENISENKNLLRKTNIIIGKCGHMFHNNCIENALKYCKLCPIDSVEWQPYRFIDTTTLF